MPTLNSNGGSFKWNVSEEKFVDVPLKSPSLSAQTDHSAYCICTNIQRAVRVGGCNKTITHLNASLTISSFFLWRAFLGTFLVLPLLNPWILRLQAFQSFSATEAILQQHAPESVKSEHCYQTTAGLLCYTFMESCTGTQTMSLANLTRPRSNFKQAWVIQESIWLAFRF